MWGKLPVANRENEHQEVTRIAQHDRFEGKSILRLEVAAQPVRLLYDSVDTTGRDGTTPIASPPLPCQPSCRANSF
ncbi:hypothetical protein [Paraburkholderia aromaticivorans]|jgi:hypothetical protein|uniref:hypothetical protein n=1 Tax=Paraburkholderia aromaticivorans TaxID=2026199 RepID=UPI0012FD07D6|nr:hypothetical protein [Paraburkholderia aromaticivorans]